VRSWRIAFAWAGVGAVACAHQHGPVASGVPAGATSASAAASGGVISAEGPGRLPQFSHQRDEVRQCGRFGGRSPDAGALVAAHPGECLAELGCGDAWHGPPPTLERCPAGVVWTVRELADGRVHPRGGESVLVRGTLGLGDWGAGGMDSRRPCGSSGAYWYVALEEVIEGACYQVDLSAARGLGCSSDPSMECCDHLPMGKEVVFVGEFVGSTDSRTFRVTLADARQCLPRADQSPGGAP
jgi:hypothetical protein